MMARISGSQVHTFFHRQVVVNGALPDQSVGR